MGAIREKTTYQPRVADNGRKKAIVIDECRAVRFLVRKILNQRAIEVAEASDGLQALAILDLGGPIDLVIIDTHTTVIDAAEVIRLIRSRQTDDSTHIVVITTGFEPERLENTQAAGANEVLKKPFSRFEMHQILNKIDLF